MRRSVLACTLLVALGAISGCGGSSKSGSSTAAASTSGKTVTEPAVESCLNAHNIEYRKLKRAGGVTNLKVHVTTTNPPMNANLNVFPGAQAAWAYVNKVRDTIETGGGTVRLHGNVMFATDSVVLPADEPDVSPIENCASG